MTRIQLMIQEIHLVHHVGLVLKSFLCFFRKRLRWLLSLERTKKLMYPPVFTWNTRFSMSTTATSRALRCSLRRLMVVSLLRALIA